MKTNISASPAAFRESFFAEAADPSVDDEYGAVLRVILYYLWRGCSLSQEAGIKGKADPKASLIAQSAYEAVLGIIQLIRIGYEADAVVLLRALMERVAIVGYLGENRHLIARYFVGDLSPYKEALSWAKKKSLPKWMMLYSTLSSVTHSTVVGPAGHINNRTAIGNAFRLATEKHPTGASLLEELLGLAIYSLYALDPFALELIQNDTVSPFSTDPNIAQNVGERDAKEYANFLRKLVARYGGNTK